MYMYMYVLYTYTCNNITASTLLFMREGVLPALLEELVTPAQGFGLRNAWISNTHTPSVVDEKKGVQNGVNKCV